MNAYDVFWCYYANIFIRLYASMFSISILQQAKLFELLNQTIKAIKNARTGPSALHRTITSGNKRCADGVHMANANATFEKHMKLLMNLHDQLRANNFKMHKLHSMQAISVVANGFMNLVSQVRY